MPYVSVTEWLNETENFSLRIERLYEDAGAVGALQPDDSDEVKIKACARLVEWMETAWRLGAEAERAKINN